MYEWASNPKKLERAVKELTDQNNALKAAGKTPVEITEEAVKEVYLKYGGLVLGEPETQKGVSEGQVTDVVEGKNLPEEKQKKVRARKSTKK